jgi:predicted Rossmann fold flavoprotein
LIPGADSRHFDILVIGGGAAGYFFAINAASKNPGFKVAILEKQPAPLTKVRISGGGRCNVTNACTNPEQLAQFYPRGGKELLPLFHRFNPRQTMEWFNERGVKLKAEKDGRVFPVTDSSRTIIDCFLQEAANAGITVCFKTEARSILRNRDEWEISAGANENFTAKQLFIGAGGSPGMWGLLEKLGHHIVPAVPSLFSFQSKDPVLQGLSGVPVPDVKLSVAGSKVSAQGPLLITHTGISGPAVLRLSAWAARELAAINYQFICKVNFSSCKSSEEVFAFLEQQKQTDPHKTIASWSAYAVPSRLWERLVNHAGLSSDTKWHAASKQKLRDLGALLFALPLQIDGKSANKEEFVTSGGVDRKEIDWKRMESKVQKDLFFGGEIIDIDAVTGGFNFQAAWTTAFIAAAAVSADATAGGYRE